MLFEILINLLATQKAMVLFEPRKAIMHIHQAKTIKNVDVDDIILGNGVSELIVMAMQGLINNEDEVLIPKPDYPLWTAAVTLAGGTPFIIYVTKVLIGFLILMILNQKSRIKHEQFL